MKSILKPMTKPQLRFVALLYGVVLPSMLVFFGSMFKLSAMFLVGGVILWIRAGWLKD